MLNPTEKKRKKNQITTFGVVCGIWRADLSLVGENLSGFDIVLVKHRSVVAIVSSGGGIARCFAHLLSLGLSGISVSSYLVVAALSRAFKRHFNGRSRTRILSHSNQKPVLW